MDKIWKQYVENNGNIAVKLPEKIAESWDLCRVNHVNPYQRTGKTLLTSTQLRNKQRINQTIIELVKNETEKIADYFQLSESLFILTDDEGYVLWRNGNPRAKDHANSMGFYEGSRWTELDVGTNAIGVTLRTKKQSAFSTFEHYSVASHDWSCFACPIFDDNELVGVLDVSTYAQEEVGHQAVIQLIAERVMNQLLKKRLAHKQALLTYVVDDQHHAILCDEGSRIVYIPIEWRGNEELIIGESILAFCRKFQGIFDSQEVYYEGELIGFSYTFYRTEKETDRYYPGVTSQNKSYSQFLEQVFQVANSDIPIHIFGESGTGKEVIAQTIHYNSPFKNSPLISLSCATISENLLESELFGYAPGAFTSANPKGYMGKIRQANGGTLFLDEVDSMPLKMQAALLRVLEEKEVTPVGGNQSIPVSFRIVTATNQDLKIAVKENRFRQDLFYRLYVCPLSIPPLRDRKEDILPLIRRFCQQNSWQINWQNEIYEIAKDYPWHGNIREFNHFMERLYLLYSHRAPNVKEIRQLIESTLIELEPQNERMDTDTPSQQQSKELPDSSSQTVKIPEPIGPSYWMSKTEREQDEILRVLKQTNYHMTKTAKILNISRTTLYRKIKKYQIDIS